MSRSSTPTPYAKHSPIESHTLVEAIACYDKCGSLDLPAYKEPPAAQHGTAYASVRKWSRFAGWILPEVSVSSLRWMRFGFSIPRVCHYIALRRTLTGVLLYEPHTHQLVLMVLLEHKNEQYTNIYKVTGTSGATKRYSYMRFVGCFFFFLFSFNVSVCRAECPRRQYRRWQTA